MSKKKTTKKTKKVSPKKKAVKKSKKKNNSKIDIDQTLLKSRQLFLFEVVNKDSANRLIREMMTLASLNDKPIVLWINSPGGSVSDGFAIIDTMISIPVPVITIINGMAASMAGLISIAGAQRLMTQNSVWMSHDIYGGGYDYGTKLLASAEHIKELQKRIFAFIAEHTKLSSADLEKARNAELWLYFKECGEKGIVDTPPKK